MKKVLLSCMVLAAGTAMAIAQDMPEYPEKLNITLNGETEFPGVTVNQEMIPFDGDDYLTVTIKGECDADEITLDITTPEGWDGMLVRSDYTGESEEIDPLRSKTPAKYDEKAWMPTWMAMYYGVTEGNSITFPVDGKEWGGMAFLVKGEEAYMINIDFLFEVRKSGESVVEAPAFPDHLDYILNGEKELPGITVRQLLDETTQVIEIKGKCDSDNFKVTFATPEGWDGLMISDFWETGEITTVTTRAQNSLIPISSIEGMGFKKGNTITYPVDGEANMGYIALIKGDMACQTFIDYSVTVSKNEGGDEPGKDPVIPESYIVNTFNEGLEVTQGYNKWGGYDVIVKGEVFANSVPIVIDVPEGWDGFISYNWSHEGDVTITENDQNPRGTRAEEIEWVSVEKLLENGYEKGNRFTFEPTFVEANNNYHTVEIHLYKGDMATKEEIISLEVRVSKADGPEVPESFEVSVSPAGLNVTQGEDYGIYTIVVEGESSEDEVEVTLSVPEGWDGFVGMTDSEYDSGDAEPMKKVQASEWEPLENMLAWGFKETNTLKFKADGEQHSGALYLYKEGLVDGANAIAVYTKVIKNDSSVDSIDSTGSARYFDLNGIEVVKPISGVYVKNLNGKTTKVVVR